MSAPQAHACPFCGIVTDTPHEKQEGCILALNQEIARARELLEQVRDPWTEDCPEKADSR